MVKTRREPTFVSWPARRRLRSADNGDRGTALLQGVEKGFCGFEIGGVEPFGEPVVDRLEER
jgi:hypothetical protein